MTIVLHRTSKIVRDVKPALLIEFAFPVADWIWDPSITAAARKVDPKYWLITGDSVSLMTQAEKDVVDVDELNATRDSLADKIERPDSFERAFALVVLDEFNAHAAKITAILNAISSSTSLAEVKANIALIQVLQQRTPAQLKAALRARMNA